MRATLYPRFCCWKLKVAADSRRDQFAEWRHSAEVKKTIREDRTQEVGTGKR